jgi:hypothetical protein
MLAVVISIGSWKCDNPDVHLFLPSFVIGVS